MLYLRKLLTIFLKILIKFRIVSLLNLRNRIYLYTIKKFENLLTLKIFCYE